MPTISYTAPVRAAFDGMKQVLFRPFDAAKWFTIRFAAWLAQFSDSGGVPDIKGGSGRRLDLGSARQSAENGLEWAAAHLALVLLAGGAIVLVVVSLSLVFMWLSARGKFMFLHNAAKNRAEIRIPWQEYGARANSLFLWQVCFALACLAAAVVLMLPGLILGLPALFSRTVTATALAGIFVSLPLLLAFGVVCLYVGAFLNNFIVPLMFKFDLRAVPAWKHFWELFKVNTGHFLTFGLFLGLLRTGVLAAEFVLAIATCCCAGCLFALPYLGTVLLLPVHVFFRLYGPLFLEQFDPGYSLFARAHAAMAAPVTDTSEEYGRE